MNEQWCRLTGELFPEPVVIADRDGNVLDWNRAAEEWFGLPPSGEERPVIPGVVLAGILPPVKGPCCRESGNLVLKGEERRIEYSILAAGPGETPDRVLLHVRDVTEQRRYEDGLLEIGQKFRHLNAEIRHDILNQLTILIGFLQFSEDLTTDDKFRDFIGKEITAGEKIQRLIEFTREYQDIGEEGPRWLDFETILGNVVNKIGEDHFVLTPLPERWEIFAHPSIEETIERLIQYIALARRPTVPVKIMAGNTPDGFNIIVEDFAPPVPSEERDLIFERGHGKAGIELWLVRELLALSGISIREDGVTGGRFVLTVPGRFLRKKG
ncbi:signal transduction histidine kinase [Methanolinea mesophila]|uniref:PAS domain-containing protein n=1 Tax=Methanolinea mesophila TaxID=547055 RepID=UPI001AE8361D|nr:PAS domain-containing protein [Methanolinea mesophila]MBP1928232.1 signal transduction histidine kinase [Methanolinea mesophila]